MVTHCIFGLRGTAERHVNSIAPPSIQLVFVMVGSPTSPSQILMARLLITKSVARGKEGKKTPAAKSPVTRKTKSTVKENRAPAVVRPWSILIP
jgi:hypothetical protein